MATVVVKLGGAAITDKATPDSLSASLDTLVDKIALVYQTRLRPHGKKLVLIHGAGSFGHPPAKKFRVKTGWLTTRDPTAAAATEQCQCAREVDVHVDGEAEHQGQLMQQQQQQQKQREEEQEEQERDRVKFGMALTRQRVLQLHHHVLQRLQDRVQLPVLSVSTYDTVETSHGQLTSDSSARLVSRVHKLLAHGFIPLLLGDAVLDLAWGSTILSGDALMHTLATELHRVHRCVFVTDVAGIYTRDPKHFDDATLIPELRCGSGPDPGLPHDGDVSASLVDDVTGSMGSKWQWVKRIMADAPQVRCVIICRAADADDALALSGDDGVDGGDGGCGDDTRRWTSIVR
ncbi:hypothetical protein E4U43_005721 [Claviceps pusilla]|uniref:Aspartate/glutamate/uridylate kinase domain-containing protein n=1 Tax=Claviceps pusilla TaxID=123648 RepID=A0A9P7NG83_9HYPO|nr:hypothetical protein E4U43_005721 [Claviceps pusilla]